MTDLTLTGVSRRYGARVALDDLSLTFGQGRITALLGPSGSGKSTLLRLIAGLEAPDSGEIWLGDTRLSGPGVFLPPERRDVGMVFQDYALFPHLTVLDNVAFGLSAVKRVEREARALELLDRVGLADRARSWPHTLSGGEQQRVALMRTLAREPRVLLMDEPFSGLDRGLRASVRDFLFPTLKASGAAVAVVTHDVDEALMLADDLALLHGGRLLQTGAPADCYRDPVSPAAAALLGDAMLLSGRSENGRVMTAFGAVSSADVPNGAVTVVVRAEAVRLDPAGVSASVTEVRFAGAEADYRVESGGAHLTLRGPWGLASAGDRVRVALAPESVRVFPAQA